MAKEKIKLCFDCEQAELEYKQCLECIRNLCFFCYDAHICPELEEAMVTPHEMDEMLVLRPEPIEPIGKLFKRRKRVGN